MHQTIMVIKIGTDNLCSSSGSLNQKIFADLARQISKLQNQGISIVLVCSGAIKAGREKIRSLRKDTDSLHKKELAGIGAHEIMKIWEKAFGKYKIGVAQILVTYANWKNRGEKRSIQSGINNYIACGIIPILNENDVVSDREIKLMDKGISENDRLARMIALLIKANSILFLTKEGGIYDKDPQNNSDAILYTKISAYSDPEKIGISNETSGNGTGGMRAKFIEASYCALNSMRVAIAGNERDVILRFAADKQVGTRIIG